MPQLFSVDVKTGHEKCKKLILDKTFLRRFRIYILESGDEPIIKSLKSKAEEFHFNISEGCQSLCGRGVPCHMAEEHIPEGGPSTQGASQTITVL